MHDRKQPFGEIREKDKRKVCDCCEDATEIMYSVSGSCNTKSLTQRQCEDRVGRLRWRAQEIRAKLGGTMNLFESFPPKPKYMRWAKYCLLHEKAEHASHTSLEMGLAKFTGKKSVTVV